MTDNQTTELREKLDTLGIEHTDANYKRHMPITAWTVDDATFCYVEGSESTDLHIDDATPKQAIAATLGSERATYSPLTAEQVRELIAPHLNARPTFDFGRHGAVWSADFQAIADELNAELGSGTCSIVKTWSDSDYVDDWRYRCSECGCFIPVNERDPETGDVISAANFCPNCGKRVSA